MRLFLSIVLVLVSSISFGQWNWPVQVNTFATPNANNYLSFFSDQYSNLQIMVTLTDQNATVVPAKLSIRMEGDGWWIETNPTNAIPSFELVPFETNIITGLDLQPYFFEGNLVKSSQSLDINNLPEGDVDICVEVFGIGGTLTTIGGVQCGMTRIIKLDAVQLTVPECDVALDTINAFPTFMWSPPNGYFGGITGILEYRLRIQEVQDPNNQVYLTNPDVGLITPLTEMDWTPSTVTQANAFDLQFQVGMTYIWRVEAQLIDNNGVIRNNMFRNGGISDYCIFTWGEAQTLEEQLTSDLIINLDANYLTEFKGHAFWNCTNPDNQGLDGFPNYILEYRLKPDSEHPNPTWHFDTLSAEVKDIYQLSPEKTYQVRVSGKAGSYVSDPTAIVEFTTPAAIDYACGDQQIPFRPNLYEENENVQAGDQVQIGQFLMTLTEATPQYSPGHYKGKGWIPVDFLGGARAKVSFDDITIDKEYIVRDGRVDVVTDGIDAWLHEELKDFVDPIYVDGTVDSAWVDTIAGVAWVTLDGVDTSFVFDPPDYPIVIHDENGYSFTIWPDGLVEVGGFLNTSNDHLDVTAENTVQFEQHPNEKYGFDPKEHIAWHENYEVIELSDSSYYFVANKSIGKDETDVVNIQIPNIVTPTFKLNDQDVLTATSAAGIYTVQIPQINSSGKKELYVYNGNARIGKLNIHVYSEKQRDVVIVPVSNGFLDTTSIKQSINKTLGEANLSFNVFFEDQWNDSTFTPNISITLPEQASLATKYSDDMRDLRDSYFNDTSRVPKEGAYYLFVIPQFDDANIDGYMVRGKALGFIKAGSGALTYAHELAHGAGALGHSWQNNGPFEGSSNNLMDYSENATNLTKAQWKELRDWDVAPSLWDDIEDSEGSGGSVNYYAVYLNISQGDTTIAKREYLGKYKWLKSGQIGNESCSVGTYPTGVNKLFKKINGVWKPFEYHHFGKVFYMAEVTDEEGIRIRYGGSASWSNYLVKKLGGQGEPANGIYEVRTLYVAGNGTPYAREVRNYELVPVIDHYRYGDDRKQIIYFNDMELSNQFRVQAQKVEQNKLSYGNLILWLESHPRKKRDVLWNNSERQNAYDHLQSGINHYGAGPVHNQFQAMWRVTDLPPFAYQHVTNTTYVKGLVAHVLVDDQDGTWSREAIEVGPSFYYSSGSNEYHIHAKNGANNCYHSLASETSQINHLMTLVNNANMDADDIGDYLKSKGTCLLYGTSIEQRKKILDKILPDAGVWKDDWIGIKILQLPKNDKEYTFWNYMMSKTSTGNRFHSMLKMCSTQEQHYYAIILALMKDYAKILETKSHVLPDPFSNVASFIQGNGNSSGTSCLEDGIAIIEHLPAYRPDYDPELNKLVLRYKIVNGIDPQNSMYGCENSFEGENFDSQGFQINQIDPKRKNLAPLAPVIYMHNGGISESFTALLNANGQDKVGIIPAYFLELHDDVFNEQLVSNAWKYGMLAVDIITIAKGVPAFSIAVETKNMYRTSIIAAEIIGSVGNVYLNTSDTVNNPELASIIDTYNSIVGIYAVGNLVVKPTFSKVYSKVKNSSISYDNLVAKAQTFKQQYESVKNTINNLPTSVRAKYTKMKEFVDEILGSGNAITSATNSFKSIDELYNQFNSFIGNKGLKHIFRGEINSVGNAVGVHHISAINSGNARIVENSVETLSGGFYKASIEVSDGAGGWVLKTDKSTFFPDSWDEIKVMQEIKSAKNNMIGSPLANTSTKLEYFGMSNSGFRIRIIIDPRYGNSPGNILTSWHE